MIYLFWNRPVIKKSKPIIGTLLVCSFCFAVRAQMPDSAALQNEKAGKQLKIPGLNKANNQNRTESKLHSLIIPAALIGYGFIALNNEELKEMDNNIKEEIWIDHPHKAIKIDNYLQYAPVLAVYGLNAAGIKGKNNVRDLSMIYLLSNAMMGITVQSLKRITRIQRPDGFGTNAFPSGHTATAFVAAELLRREYKNVSSWYGIAGYATAVTTAYLRMYNNKHWFRDLLPGAGIGILSTQVAYWLYPSVKKIIFNDKPGHVALFPFYQNHTGGLSLTYSFAKEN